jgi:hypothetical protein
MSVWTSFISYDPVTGATVMHHYDDATQKQWWTTEYDQQIDQAAKDVAAAIRNDGRAWSRGLKTGWAGTAILPASVRHEMRERGLDPYSKDPDVQKTINKLLNGEFKLLKTTDKRL